MFPDAPGSLRRSLEAAFLPAGWQDSECFVILDNAFDVGRFTATCEAFENAPGRCVRLFYLTVCPVGTRPPKPSPGGDAPGARIREELSRQWPPALPGLHALSLNQNRVELRIAFGDAEREVRLFDAVCDAFFLDGAVPLAAGALARLARTGAKIALQNSSPHQLELLKGAGFEISHIPALNCFAGCFRAKKRSQPIKRSASPVGAARSALVIGAGLAGTAVAAALAARNWRVTLLEREAAPAKGASGNLAAVFSPLLSLDDGRAARLSRACYLSLLRELRSFETAGAPVLWQSCGVLQLPKEEKEERYFRELALHHSYPEFYVRFLEKDAAEKLAGLTLPSGGWFFQEGGWVHPPSLCAARIRAHARLTACFEQDVTALEKRDGLWTASGASGQILANAPCVILANAWEANRLLPQPGLPFKRVRGQVAHLPAGAVPQVPTVLSMDGYLTPLVNGFHSLGATYDFGSDEPRLDPDAHKRNLERLSRMLPGKPPLPVLPAEGRVGFRSLTPDRMPIVGALPAFAESAQSGLFCILGLGSRGLVWSTLLGKYLAALIEGTPSPLPLDLAAPLSPGRFLERGSAVP